QVQLLGGDQREPGIEVEPHLPAEHRAGACACAVGLLGAVVEDVAQQVQVLFHRRLRPPVRNRPPAAPAGWAGDATATARTGRPAPAECSAAGPWRASRTRDSRSEPRVRARTPPRTGTRRTAARTCTPLRTAAPGGWTTTTASRTSPAPRTRPA